MFTGIITAVSALTKVTRNDRFVVCVARPEGWELTKGESISINGVCSTVFDFDDAAFCVEYMPETFLRTTVQDFEDGTKVNLEKSVRAGDELGGHIVQGHVYTTGTVAKITKEENAHVVRIACEPQWLHLVAQKGSVAIDGVSLTVVECRKDWFSVSIVEHTWQNTLFGEYKKGTRVNIEFDVLAAYVARQFDVRQK